MAGSDISCQAVLDQLFGAGDAETVPPSSDLEAAFEADSNSQPARKEVFQRLYVSWKEALDEVSETQKSMQPWKSLMTQNILASMAQKVFTTLQVPGNPYARLTPEVSSALHIFTQLASYIRFLMRQENDSAYNAQQTQIKDTVFKITKMGRIIRQLLPLSDEEIRNYVTQGIANRVLALDKCVSAVKRAVCCSAVELMLATLKRVNVSLESNSVTFAYLQTLASL